MLRSEFTPGWASVMSILATAGSLAGCLTSQITQLVIDIPALINARCLLDVSRQHCSVHLDLLNHVLHHALDHIVDLADVLDLSLWSHWHVHTWHGSPLLDSSLQRLGVLLSGCCAVGVRAVRVHASGLSLSKCAVRISLCLGEGNRLLGHFTCRGL